MIVGLLSIIGAYALAIAVVHLGRSLFSWERRKPVCYVLVTRNNATQIEWYLRMLLFVSRLKGRTVHIVMLDEHSEDETLSIAQRLAASWPHHVEIVERADAAELDRVIARFENDECILVRLANDTELRSIPLFQ